MSPLEGWVLPAGPSTAVAAAAARLLVALGAAVPGATVPEEPGGRPRRSLGPLRQDDDAPAGARWARCGLAELSGRAGGPPALPAVDVHAGVAGLLAVVELLSGAWGRRVELDERVVVERAALGGLRRAGRTSCGGSTQLLATGDGLVAVCLARSDDIAMVPAWLGAAVPSGRSVWDVVTAAVADRQAREVVDEARELGLAVAPLGGCDGGPSPADAQRTARWGRGTQGPLRLSSLGTPGRQPSRPLVVDLSSLWAGPLCAHVLGRAGARVVKVESTRRPDGARSGPQAFYRQLHAGHEAVALDFSTAGGRARLRSLLEAADVVIEGSRPRALEQLDIEPAAVLAAHPGASWVSITGYGRSGPGRQWVGFGDDAAVAGGLVADRDDPVFCGDALADPLAGLMAAAGTLAAWLGGGGLLVDIALREAAAFVAAGAPLEGAVVRPPGPDGRSAVLDADGTCTPVAAPRPRPLPEAPVPGSGADTARVLAELG